MINVSSMTPTWFGPSWHHSHHCHHHYHHWRFGRIHIHQPGFVTGQCKDPLEVSVLSVAGQLIRWEHTPTHFSVDFLVFTYCIKLYSLALLNMKTPLQAQDRHCKDRVWVSELKSKCAAGQKQRLLFKEWASWWRQTSGWIGRKVKLATQYKCTCAATCPHTHLPNNEIQLNRICCLWNVSTIFPTPSP